MKITVFRCSGDIQIARILSIAGAVTLSMFIAVGAAQAKGKAPAHAAVPEALTPVMKQLFEDTNLQMHQVTLDSQDLIRLACSNISHNGTAQVEEKAYLTRTVDLAIEELDKDVRPAFEGSGNDYAHLSAQLESYGHATSGSRRGNLFHAALYTARAAQGRKEEANYLKRRINQQASMTDCEAADLGNAVVQAAAGAVKDEDFALTSMHQLGASHATRLRSLAPLKFDISVTLSSTYTASETLGADGTCSDDAGQGSGTYTEKSTFDSITIEPTNAVHAVSNDMVATTVSGTWASNGNFHPDEDCTQNSTPFSCGGSVGLSTDGELQKAVLTVLPDGGLATLNILLPAIGQTNLDSCANGADQNTEIPLMNSVSAFGSHYNSIGVTVDGKDLRAADDTTTITGENGDQSTGLEGGGGDEPDTNCQPSTAFTTVCSLAGSTATATIEIKPVG